MLKFQVRGPSSSAKSFSASANHHFSAIPSSPGPAPPCSPASCSSPSLSSIPSSFSCSSSRQRLGSCGRLSCASSAISAGSEEDEGLQEDNNDQGDDSKSNNDSGDQKQQHEGGQRQQNQQQQQTALDQLLITRRPNHRRRVSSVSSSCSSFSSSLPPRVPAAINASGNNSNLPSINVSSASSLSSSSPPLRVAPPVPPKPNSLKSSAAAATSASPSTSASSSVKSSPRRARSSAAGELERSNLRVYTGQIKPDMDYKTLRLAQTATTAEVIRQLVEDKLRLNLRDLNLFHLFMEVRTVRRADGVQVRSLLELDADARPLELQRCHPDGMSRFILGMDSNAILARIHDNEVYPESNYKSVFISRRTSCAQVLAMLRQIYARQQPQQQKDGRSSSSKSRHHRPQLGIEAISELRLFVRSPVSGGTGGGADAQIPGDCCLAGVCLSLLPGQQIVLRRVIVPRSEGF